MVAVVVAPAQADRAEVHEPRVERVVRAERTRPIAAVVARFVHEVTVAAIARQREEDGVAVCAGYNSSFYAFKPFRFFSNDFFASFRRSLSVPTFNPENKRFLILSPDKGK